MDAPEAEKDSPLPAVPRQKKVSSSEDFILFNVLTDMADHLNHKDIGMWLLQGQVIPDGDVQTLTKMRLSPNSSTAEAVIELARMVHRNGTLKQFITALEKSSLTNPGHTTVLEAIKEKQEEVTNGRHTGPTSENDNPPQNSEHSKHTSSIPAVDCNNVMHITDPSLFETMPPYRYFEYGPYIWIDLVMALFMVYQVLAILFITLCEEKCLSRVFSNGLGLPDLLELGRRMCLFTLRVAVRTILPFVFYWQVFRLADGERKYQKQLHDKTSSKQRPPSSSSLTIGSSHANRHGSVTLSTIIIVLHAALFSFLLFYIGAFVIAEDRLLETGIICIKELLLNQIQMPFLGIQLQVCQFFDCLGVFFMLIVVGILKDCYCIENSSTAAVEHYEIIRKRWIIIDMFCYATPFFLALMTAFMFAVGNPLVPESSKNWEMDKLTAWCFWTISLSILHLCGSAANKFLKACCILGHVGIIVILGIHVSAFALPVVKIHLPPGSGVVLLYTTLAVTSFNFLVCLMGSHYRAKKYKQLRFSAVCLVLLLLSLIATPFTLRY